MPVKQCKAIETQRKAWNIRAFPVALRVEIANIARRSGLTVAEWLTDAIRHALGGAK